MIIGLDASRAAIGQRTGTEAYAFFLIRALIPLAAERGHRLRLYFNQPPPAGAFPDAAHVEPIVIPRRRLWTHLRLGAELRRRPPDVFFTPAHVIPLGYQGPSVATIHDLGYEYFPEAHPRRQLAYLRWSTRHNARLARRVIADSRATRDDLVKFYGVDAAKIDVVYPGADPYMRRAEDDAEIAPALTKYGIQPPYLLYLGTLQPRKNLVRLVEAFAVSGLHAEGYCLVLAGKAGWLAQPLLEAIRGLSSAVSRQIILPGYIGETEKNLLFSPARRPWSFHRSTRGSASRCWRRKRAGRRSFAPAAARCRRWRGRGLCWSIRWTRPPWERLCGGWLAMPVWALCWSPLDLRTLAAFRWPGRPPASWTF